MTSVAFKINKQQQQKSFHINRSPRQGIRSHSRPGPCLLPQPWAPHRPPPGPSRLLRPRTSFCPMLPPSPSEPSPAPGSLHQALPDWAAPFPAGSRSTCVPLGVLAMAPTTPPALKPGTGSFYLCSPGSQHSTQQSRRGSTLHTAHRGPGLVLSLLSSPPDCLHSATSSPRAPVCLHVLRVPTRDKD